jgi:DHA3 family macrolide efflux protein-like MFS transporter
MATKSVHVFKNPNFSLVFFGVLVSNIAHIFFSFAISLYVLDIANQAFGKENAALVQAAYLAVAGIILVLLMPFGGSLADKLNKVRTMYITDFIRGFTILGVAFIIFSIEEPIILIATLFLMNIILSINSAFFGPAASSLLRFIVSDEELQPAASYLHGSSNLTSIIGVILGGILYVSLGIFWIFIMNGIAYIFSAITEMFIRYKRDHITKSQLTFKDVLHDIKDGIIYIRKEKAIFAVLVMALSLNFFVSPFFSNGLPYFIKFGLSSESSYLFSQWLRPENWLSVMSVTFSIAAMTMSLILSKHKTKDNYGKQMKLSIIAASFFLGIAAIFMIGYYANIINISTVLVGVSMMQLGIGFSVVLFNVPFSIVIQRKVDRSQLGKVNAVTGVLSQALIPFASLIAGILISQISPIALYMFIIVGMTFVSISYYFNKTANQI